MFKDILKENKKEVEKKETKNPEKEGVSFTDENGNQIIISSENDFLFITKLERKTKNYLKDFIVLKKEYIPILGDIFLDFYNNGNLEKSLKKFEVK